MNLDDAQLLDAFQELQGRHVKLAMDRVPDDIGPNQILRNKLWIGDGVDARNLDFLQTNGITAIVSLGCGNSCTTFENIQYHRIFIEDDQSSQLAPHFDEAVDFIHAHSVVFVHCVAGVSRSASICIAYLMKYGMLSFKAAYGVVKIARPFICPNAGFMARLLEYENSLIE